MILLRTEQTVAASLLDLSDSLRDVIMFSIHPTHTVLAVE